jgi:hypothetical protein
MRRIEPKLSGPMGSEYGLQGTAPGLSGPTRNLIAFGWIAPEVQLVGADNAVKGVLRELARSTVRDSSRFVFSAANAQHETPLPPRVNTLEDAKAFVRRHLAEGQWMQSPGQGAGPRHSSTGETQSFGPHGQARATQTTSAELAWKKHESSASLPDNVAPRPQMMPSLLRTAAEAQRHVVLHRGNSATKNQVPTQSTPATSEQATQGVSPVEREAVEAQAAINPQPRPVRKGIKAHQLIQHKELSVAQSSIILTSSGEVFGEPKISPSAGPSAKKGHDLFPLPLLVTLLATVTLIAFSTLTFYLWGPRPGLDAIHEVSFSAPNATLSATPSLPSVSVAQPETSQRSASFEARNENSARKTVQSSRMNKGAAKCNSGSTSADAEAACPNSGQAPNSTQ